MIHVFSSLLIGALVSNGQTENPYLKAADQKQLDRDAIAFLDAGESVVQKAAKSTVGIYFGSRRLAYGLVVEDNMIVTKWSEVAVYRGMLKGLASDGKFRSLEVLGGLEEHDVAVLSYTGDSLPVLEFSSKTELEAGDFLLVPRSDGKVATAGVVSVLPRSLRALDKGYLGVSMSRAPGRDPLVVSGVEPRSAAAEAGVRPGDRIVKIGEEDIETFEEMSNLLKSAGAGQDIKLTVQRGRDMKVLNASLKGTNNLMVHGMDRANPRAQKMQHMGLRRLSRGSQNFPNVMQTDLDLNAEDCGAPVLNLKGDVVGMVISRASRIKTYVLPISVIEDLLALAKENE